VEFAFGDHVLDVDQRELRRRGEPIALEPQVFDLLVYLVRNRHRVVTKDDLLQADLGRQDRLRIDNDQPHQCRDPTSRRQW
jgi:DNA-binding winged helix-turn-helix (wHTH) protein